MMIIEMISYNISRAIEFASGFLRMRYPANVFHICDELGIKIVLDKPLTNDGYLICHNGRKIIFVNGKVTNRHRQNFIISHELGHFLLHRDQLYSCSYISDSSDFTINTLRQESEANRFASELLIPYAELIKSIPKSSLTFSDIFKIASAFDVSVTHAALQAVTASNTENEILLCYDNRRLRWYKAPQQYINVHAIPTYCPIDPSSTKRIINVTGIWDAIYSGTVRQEIFHSYGEQYLILLSIR